MQTVDAVAAVEQVLSRIGSYPQEVEVADVVKTPCSWRLYLQLIGEEPDRLEDPAKVLLRLYEYKFGEHVQRYLAACFPARFSRAAPTLYSGVQVQHLGYLDGLPVMLSHESTRVFPQFPARSKLIAAARAHMLGAEAVIVILVDRNTQKWSAWTLTDIDEAGKAVAKVPAYLASLWRGEGFPGGTASDNDCAACPYATKCDADRFGPPDPWPSNGIRAVPTTDIIIELDRYLFSLNFKDSGRATHCIHPSELSMTPCDRRIAYGLMGIRQMGQISSHLRRIFNAGHALHDIVQMALAIAKGDAFQEEVRVQHEQLKITGHCDGQEDVLGYEIKSAGGSSYKKFTKAKREHVDQANIYCALLGLERVLYLYVNKEEGVMKQFVTPHNRVSWKKTATRCAHIIKTVQQGLLPPQIDIKSKCGECPYMWTCKPAAYKRQRRF